MEGPVRKIPLAELKKQVGNEVGSSEWMPITQQMIDTFADLTGDHYFIHVNPARAAAETPFGAAIAVSPPIPCNPGDRIRVSGRLAAVSGVRTITKAQATVLSAGAEPPARRKNAALSPFAMVIAPSPE